MKYILSAFTAFVLTINISYSQQARIQEFFPKFDDKIDASRFVCDEKDRSEGIGFSEIEFLHHDTLEIINHTPSPSPGGISIRILLDTNLKVISITYNEWTAEQGTWERSFSVESPSVLLNFNPFKKGAAGLQGRYNFIVKIDFTPSEELKRKGEEPTTDYKLFYARFKCG